MIDRTVARERSTRPAAPPDGLPAGNARPARTASSAGERLHLYRQMLRIRLVEERIAELYPKQEMRCPVHLCIGQEAVAVGVCAHLSSEDVAFSGHRSHGHYLAKGGDLKAMLAELYGKAGGCSGGKGGSMHLIDESAGFLGATAIVATTIPIAVGAALGFALRGQDRVSVAFFGEAATEEGVFHESVNFAAVKKLPVVFVCENNLYSVYSSMEVRQPAGREVVSVARGHGIVARQGDGNEVLEVSALAAEAIGAARRGAGPVFLELKTYRWREHCGPNFDNQLGYRSPEEFEAWKARCPLTRARKSLLDDGAQPADLDGIARDLRAEIEEAVQFAELSPFPSPETMLDHTYAAGEELGSA